MSRYQPSVSQEGFMDVLKAGGNWLAKVGKNMQRNAVIKSIPFDGGLAPEVNGMVIRNYNMLIASIEEKMASGEPWDAVINVEEESFQILGRPVSVNNATYFQPGGTVPIHKSIILFGQGNTALVRLPLYENDSETRTDVLGYLTAEIRGLKIKYNY